MKLGKRCSMITDMNGTKTCMRDGKIHRKGGPAIEYVNGIKYWYVDGVCHREDGPACEDPVSGYNQWWLNGIRYSEENHKSKLQGLAAVPEATYNYWAGSGDLHGTDGY